VVTVGQEALQSALAMRGASPLVYTMVLFPPPPAAHSARGLNGVAMIPAPRFQLQVLMRGFGLRRVAVFYNPGVTGFLVRDLQSDPGLAPGFIPVPVSSEAELLARLQDGLSGADGLLLVPDPTLLTETGLKAMVGACFARNIPLAGFSPMYLDMGAAMTISVEEGDVAKRAAALALGTAEEAGDTLDGMLYLKSCQVQVSRKAAARLGLKVDAGGLRPFGVPLWGE
jgi:hypothetical protein